MQKRKLSDMLGPQWTKEELERFYEAYRKHGKDWKKVSCDYHTGFFVGCLLIVIKLYLDAVCSW